MLALGSRKASSTEGLFQGQKEKKVVKGCKTSLKISNKPSVLISSFLQCRYNCSSQVGSAGRTLEDSAEVKDALALTYCLNSPLLLNLTVETITQKAFSKAKPTVRIQAGGTLQGYLGQ